MFKKLACFTGWLLVLSLSLVFCLTLGLWQNWNTLAILLFWLLMLSLAILLWSTFYAIIRAIKGKQGRRWFDKYRLSRCEYVLLNHWKTGASIVKRNRRQRVKLPWYILVGDRCGKSTLLASAGLPRFYYDGNDAVTGPTRTLQWWFFRRVGILELSSNFLNGSANFRRSWARLAHWCAQMPTPAGIIVTLPVSALMSDDLSALHTLARQQRVLIEPLVRRFSERLPLYVIITQCDLFPGFSLWHQQLSARQRQQPLGYSWHIPPHIDGQDELTLQPLFTALKQGMARVRLSMARTQTLSAQDNITLLDFPEAFANLEQKLRYALASLCEPNAYFSHICLSSVWFCATEPQKENHGRRTSIFVHDLLTERLHSLSQNRGGQRWYQRPQGKITCAILLILSIIWLLLSASFSYNRLQPEITQLSPDALATFLANDEQLSTTSLRYLPFQLLLKQQQVFAESQLARIPSTPRLPQTVLADFQQQVLMADPTQQRDLILQLAHAVLTWQLMRDGATLDTLKQDTPISSELQQRTYPIPLAPLTVMALERHYIQHPDGEYWLQTARQLLVVLVNNDPALSWLTAPAAILPPLQANAFWPQLSNSISLPGAWSYTGKMTINRWMTQIERAIGQQQPLFKQTRDLEPARRQSAWGQYLIDVTAVLSSDTPTILTNGQLIALGQNQSQAMRFAESMLNELKDIPDAQAQPWLTTLRQLQHLKANSNASTLLNQASQIDNRIRQSFSDWLQGTSSELRTNIVQPSNLAWRQWQYVRNRAANEAVAQQNPNARLTRGLFTPEKNSNEHNPLTELLPALTTLQELLSPQNSDASISAVWRLYRDDARRLLENAVVQSACWLNSQWKSTIIWPLNKNSEQSSYEDLRMQSQQSIRAFLQGTAKVLLTTNSRGPDAAEYAGIKVPLTPEFIRLIHQMFPSDITQDIPQRVSTLNQDKRAYLKAKVDELTVQQNELEKQNWKINVTSQPATVPSGAQVFPIGTQLTLNCQKGDQQLRSMNFAEKHEFIWQPGQCSGLTLSVIFPDFTANYQLNGDDAWPWFVNRFISGEALLDSIEFGDNAALLLQIGIKHILVRFTVSTPQGMGTAWRDWNKLNTSISDLNSQIDSLDDSADASSLKSLTALPADIAQCW